MPSWLFELLIILTKGEKQQTCVFVRCFYLILKLQHIEWNLFLKRNFHFEKRIHVRHVFFFPLFCYYFCDVNVSEFFRLKQEIVQSDNISNGVWVRRMTATYTTASDTVDLSSRFSRSVHIVGISLRMCRAAWYVLAFSFVQFVVFSFSFLVVVVFSSFELLLLSRSFIFLLLSLFPARETERETRSPIPSILITTAGKFFY